MKCSACGAEFTLGPKTLPECPTCIVSRMKLPDGMKSKHFFGGAKPGEGYASYIAHGVDPKQVFDYMAQGPHIAESGCEVFYSSKHDSFNAVTYKPLGEIPGSGAAPGGP